MIQERKNEKSESLPDRNFESVELIGPRVNGFCIIFALKVGIVTVPDWTGRPLAEHLGFTGIVTGSDCSVQSARSYIVLHPVNHDVHVVLRIWPRLQAIDTGVNPSGC